MPSPDPRLRVLFLVAVAVGCFFLARPWQVGAVVVALAAAWLVVGLPPRRLLRQVYKLWAFALFIVASYALTRDDAASDRWVHLHLGRFDVPVNVVGAAVGLTMVLRVLAVVLASQVARAGDARAVARGLGRLGVPATVALAIDAVLALLGGGPGSGGGGGGGRGGGGGGGGGRGAAAPGGFWAALGRLGRGDVDPLVRRLERHIARVEEHTAGDARAAALGRDLGVIAGVALTMLGIKALKLLPGIPFAPGYKTVLLTPLYIVASLLTRTRLGATLTGATMGTVAFLLGDGKYGVFEIAKHVAPGLASDALVPLWTRGGRIPGGLAWSLLGGLIAVGRFATIFVVTLAVAAPRVAYAMLVPGLTVHVVFGVASGYVSFHLMRAVERLRAPQHDDDKEPT